jgi:hypothetical protein
MDARDLFPGADNTGLQPALGSNFCIRPQNCVFQDRFCADAAVSSYDCAATQVRARIDARVVRYALGPLARSDETRFPAFAQDCPVDFEIFSARRDVEPFSVVHYHAADSSALAYPIRDDGNKGDLFVRRNPPEDRRVPNCDIREIKISFDAVAVADVYDTLVAQSHSRSQTGVTQSKRHVVATTEMFINQRLELEVGQDIAAIRQKRFGAEMTFRVLDTAARFEEVRFVNESDGKPRILARGKEIFEQSRMPVRVDKESVHSDAYQMVERESNERLLKDRDERLRNFLGQYTQARAKTGCQNECLSDFAHSRNREVPPPTLKLRRGGRLHSQLCR